jgi:hypothetical protein
MRTNAGALVVAGGLATLASSSAAADVWQLPMGATAWQAKTQMPVERGGCAYGTLQSPASPTPLLACAGGEAGTSALPYMQTYDPVNDMWACAASDVLPGCTTACAIADLPMPTAGTPGAAIDGRLYVPGGSRTLPTLTTGFAPVDTVYVYAPLSVGSCM